MSDYENVNRELWDAWTDLHVGSAFYDVEAFLAGTNTLGAIERDLVGDPAGRRLLHLQCHFGLDTLSWARLGAEVTGVDFSARAIAAARRLADETGVPARFIQSSVYDLPDRLDETFDVVFTSWGVLPWLPDLERWARVAARFLGPGGSLCLAEFHPIFDILDVSGRGYAYPYFADGPIEEVVTGSYADRGDTAERREVTFAHPLGAVVTAIVQAGLRIERLEEFPWSPNGLAPWLVESAPGRWVPAFGEGALPLTYAVRARRRAREPTPSDEVSATGKT